MKIKMKIYRDFDDYWQNGDHGWSSASIDIAKEEWERFAPTINASRDDYKNLYLSLCKEIADRNCMHVDALYKYISLFTKEDAPTFPRWWSKEFMKEFDSETPKDKE